MRLVAPRIVTDVSYVTDIKQESHFAWQAQYLVILECHFSWQAQYLVILQCHLMSGAVFGGSWNDTLRGRRSVW